MKQLLTCHVSHVPVGNASTQFERRRQHYTIFLSDRLEVESEEQLAASAPL